MNFQFNQNIKIALESIKTNRLRAIITMLIISIGITALVGIFSAIDAIKNGINSNFTSMGANTFTIRNSDIGVRIGRGGRKAKKYDAITFKEALRFKEDFDLPGVVSVSTFASTTARLKHDGNKTNPNIQVLGSDENYLQTAGYEIEKGRNFSQQEVQSGKNFVIIGKDIEALLFPKTSAVDKILSIGALKYTVIGVLKTKGSSSGFGGDKVCIIPLTNARQYFSSGRKMTFTINVLTPMNEQLEMFISEARGIFRKVRKLNVYEEDDFEITKSDTLATMLIDDLRKVTLGATVIGVITLLGAAIGLMNILLVSVTERTREIGIRKAMGATPKIIRNQFLMESIVICLLGGSLGIVLGIVIGNIISMSLDTGFFIPWFWMISGYVICVIVGLVSGYAPARRAANLDPIESLRFE